MLKNYKKMNNGVIQQIVVDKIKYDENYVNTRYNTYGNLVENMSNLRLGYLIGALGYTPSSILDVGYGNGSFIKTCSKIINKCYGNDVSGYSLPENIEFVYDIYNNEFEVVCFFDVLEHFDNIYDIKNLKTKYIYISVPECHYISDSWFQNWKHRRPNEHLYHFNRESLVLFMQEIGYSTVSLSNIEDLIRTPIDDKTNILTGIFKKI
jgi:hypothetical protein